MRITHGENPLNLIIEVTDEKKKDKAAKVATAQNLWCLLSITTVGTAGGPF
ncbi:MAG: hypothetical protein PHU44_03945 [Syntrophales bacterium]|nr:hypothetical protein [Syntrophales bacterium]MDD5640567.1 hypothetical protein [Syntrophales bacterium]